MVSVYALCGGLIDLDRSVFFSDVEPGTRVTAPVICFLISHPSGHVLVDTGVHRQAIIDPVGRLGERRAGLFRMRSAPTDEVVTQLALLGLAPDDIRCVVNSHFHFDHCGGNEFFPHATFLVQRPEMEAARQVLAGATLRYNPSPIDFDHPLDYRLIDGEHDVFGDGQILLVPTYGHTPGHQSVRVRTGKGGDLVLTEDACYTRETMDRDVLPNVVWDTEEMSRSLATLRQFRDRQGATVIYGHDADQWHQIRRAPAPLI
ncbi:MAG TPA: N-acyl homoserine lactonase family protein [Candidatus Methylomirabilis sp.]|nr:N-acyl homoserine lactonase family protein [Candidatus Methylomirabilis sp.]